MAVVMVLVGRLSRGCPAGPMELIKSVSPDFGVMSNGVAVFVNFGVALGAQQHQVGDVGGSVVFPGQDVVGIASLWADAAAYAASVSAV